MITRFSVLPDDRRLMLGIDKARLFKPGMVYEAISFDGQIIFKEVGKYALPEKGQYPCEYSDANGIINQGTHLVTKDELTELQ